MSPFADPRQTGARACELACELVGQFGPRPAGSPAEAAARRWAAGRLAGWGYRVETRSLLFPPFPQLSLAAPAAGLYLALSACLVGSLPLAALLAPLVFFLLPGVLRWEVQRRPRRAESENLLALPAGQAGPLLLLAAHLDSAPARRLGGVWLRLYSRSLDLAQRAAVAAAAGGALRLLGLALPDLLVWALALAGLAAGGWLAFAELWNQLERRPAFSPGANDNASGVGLLLALAEQAAAQPPEGLRLGFLITSAEETGLHGARALAQDLPAGLRDSGCRVLALDMVGSGDTLRYVTRDGVWPALRLSEIMNGWVAQGVSGSRPLWYIEKSGDHAPFAAQGLEAAALQVTGSPAAELRYHTRRDTPDSLEPGALALAAAGVLAVVAGLQGQKP